MDWVTLQHKGHGGWHRVPDSPDVVTWYEARGWQVAEPGEAVPPMVVVPADVAWVTVRHTRHGGVHELPNDPAVLADAATRGWIVDMPVVEPEQTATGDVVQEQDPEPAAVGDTEREGTHRG